MSIATQWAASRKEDRQIVYAPTSVFGPISIPSDLQAFQRMVARQRAIAEEFRLRDALPYCEREEETLP